MNPPSGPRGTILKVEDESPVYRPTMKDLYGAIERMRPTGPAFVIVQREDGNYAQAGGGNGMYAVEWREYGEPFIHLLAGKGIAGDETCIVQMHYGHTEVAIEEVLTKDDVKTLLGACLRDGQRPPGYEWRDVSYAFVGNTNNGKFVEAR